MKFFSIRQHQHDRCLRQGPRLTLGRDGLGNLTRSLSPGGVPDRRPSYKLKVKEIFASSLFLSLSQRSKKWFTSHLLRPSPLVDLIQNYFLLLRERSIKQKQTRIRSLDCTPTQPLVKTYLLILFFWAGGRGE